MLLGVALTYNFAMAADIRYVGDGDWSTTANWSGGVKPGDLDAARGNWGGNTVTVTTTESVGAVQWGVDEASTLRIQTGGNLTAVGAQWSGLGAGGTTTGTLFVEGGQLTINNSDFYMGLGGNPYTVSANISSGLMDVNGVFRQDNGSVASGTTTLSGTGVLEVNQFFLSGANNTLTFAGGTLRAGASSATWLTGNGTARINSTGATIDTGAFDVTASSALTQNGASPGGGLTKSGAGTLTLTGANTYTGATIINGGKLQLSGSGNLAGGNYAGAITLSNSATFENAGGGTLALSGAITGSGTVSMNGGGQLLIQNGGNSYSALNIAAGRVFIMSTGALPAAATVGLTGGTLDFDTGGTYNSAITVSSGANIAARAATNLTNVTLPGAGTVIFNNDDAPTAALSISSNQTLAGALTVQIGGDRMGGSGGALGGVTLSGNLTGSGSLVVASSGNISNPNYGKGVLTLSGANDYTGTTSVTRGTLVVNGSISTSVTTVSSGATLGGIGTVGALTIESGAFVTPGNSPGILTVDGNYTQAGQYTAEINGIIAGSGYDQIGVTGTVDISGGSLVTLFSGAGYNPGDLLFILLNDSTDAITGTYSGFAQGATVATYGGMDWTISYSANGNNAGSPSFTGGNDIALMAVPEPNVAALFGALGLLALLRRRR